MNHWTDEIEEICEKLRVNCVNLSEYHRKRFYHFKSYGKWFRLPLIILASLNSTASVGLQPVLDQQIISGITCLIGMIMGIIGSLELYLGIQAAMELELKHSKEYYTLAIHLYKTLALRRENRLEDGKEYLNEKYSMYIKLCESSNLLDKKMKNDLLARVPDKMLSDNQSSTNSDDCASPKLHRLDSLGNNYLDTSKFRIDIPKFHQELEDSPLISDIKEESLNTIVQNNEIINNVVKKHIESSENIIVSELEKSEKDSRIHEFLEPPNFNVDISGSEVV